MGEAEPATSDLWVVGVVMSLVGSLTSNLGVQVQKIGFNKNEQLPPHLRKTKPYLIPLWVMGLSGMIIGAILDMVSLVFAAQSLLAPLAASSLVVNLVLSPLLVKEMPDGTDVLCTVVMGVGCVLAVAFADKSAVTYSLDELINYFTRTLFLGWAACVLAGMGAFWWVISKGTRPLTSARLTEIMGTRGPPGGGSKKKKKTVEDEEEEEEPQCEIDYLRSARARATPELTRVNNRALTKYAFFFAGLGGQSGGNSILFAKAVGEAVKSAYEGSADEILRWEVLLLVAGLALSMYVQLYFLNEGMRQFDMLITLPIYQAFWIGGATVNGIVFFTEYTAFDTTQWIMFPLGCTVTIAGIMALTSKYKPKGTAQRGAGHGSGSSPTSEADNPLAKTAEEKEQPWMKEVDTDAMQLSSSTAFMVLIASRGKSLVGRKAPGGVDEWGTQCPKLFGWCPKRCACCSWRKRNKYEPIKQNEDGADDL